MVIQLLTDCISVNGVPTLSTQGFSLESLRYPDACTLTLNSTAGSGTMATTIKMWCWSQPAAKWFPLGVGADTTKGEINAVASIGETTTDSIRHSELMGRIKDFDRIYAQVMAISGTATKLQMYAISRS